MNTEKGSRTPAIRLVCALLAFVMLAAGTVFLVEHETVSALSDKVNDFKNNASVKKYQKEIADIEKQTNDVKKKISSLSNNVDDLLQKKTFYDKLIEMYDSKIEESEAYIAELDKQIEEIDIDIADKVESSEELYERIKERMVVSYESGGTNATYLEVIFGAESIIDFLVGLENAVSILSYDSDLMTEYRELTEDLAEERELAVENREAQKSVAESLETSRAESEKLQKEAQELLDAAKLDLKSSQDMLDKLEAQEKAAESELDSFVEDLIKKQGATQSVADGEFMWPLETRFNRVNSYFGKRQDPFGSGKIKNHQALDINAAIGTKVYASNSGTVVKSVYHASYGYYIMIDHGAKVFSLYAHCSKLLVKEGEKVEKGQLIALTGATGSVTGPHLHFEMREGNTRVDPLKYVSVP